MFRPHRFLSLLLVLLGVSLVRAEDGPTAPLAAGVPATEALPSARDARQRTAVALNYARASFHRIRRTPSKRVLLEERERILDNLDLRGILNEEVIGLYSAVLDEIGRVQIAERERAFIEASYRRDVRRAVATTFFGTGMQVATGQYLGALKSGAAGWWDVRSRGAKLEFDEWRIDRENELALVAKSSKFLDTSWRMARENDIPDHWLIRDANLDQLDEALRERDPEIRLRVLGRMERYLECYPPYHYYVARTQQELGQLFAAANTYGRLAELGTGHFRKDELLATGLANRAVIQAYLRQPEAAETARIALRHADDVWQANLACAAVLEQFAQRDAAEDAILRNLDVELERTRSTAQLVGLYHRTHDLVQLRKRLSDPADVVHVPAPLLAAACAQLARNGQIPDVALNQLVSSLQAYPETRFGMDDVVVQGTSRWLLEHAGMGVLIGTEAHTKASHSTNQSIHEARFGGIANFGNPLQRGGIEGPFVVALRYPDGTTVRILLGKAERRAGESRTSSLVSTTVRKPVAGDADEPPLTRLRERSNALVPIAIDIDGERLLLVETPQDPEQTKLPPVAVPAPE